MVTEIYQKLLAPPQTSQILNTCESLRFHPVQYSIHVISQPSSPTGAFHCKISCFWCNYFITVAHDKLKALKSDLRFCPLGILEHISSSHSSWSIQTLPQVLLWTHSSISVTFCSEGPKLNPGLEVLQQCWFPGCPVHATWWLSGWQTRFYRHKVLGRADLTADLAVFFTGRIRYPSWEEGIYGSCAMIK